MTPPTESALIEHTKRAVYQAGHVWGQSLILEPALPSPKQWGWKEDDHNWQPHWTSLPTVAACCQVATLLDVVFPLNLIGYPLFDYTMIETVLDM